MPRILVVQHNPAEHLAALEGPIAASGIGIDVVVSPDPLPRDLAGHRGLVVMGGAMGVYEADRYPFLDDEIRLLRQALAAGVPALGVCLGSQLLAAAAGGRVYPGADGPEVGWHPVTRLADDPWLAGWPSSFEPLQWHGDTFDLPPGATLLASSPRYLHQAFRLGSALGLQFHVEATAELAREWLTDPALPAGWRPGPEHLARCSDAAGRMAPLAAVLGTAFAAAVLTHHHQGGG